jgi:hypothetical protein
MQNTKCNKYQTTVTKRRKTKYNMQQKPNSSNKEMEKKYKMQQNPNNSKEAMENIIQNATNTKLQ